MEFCRVASDVKMGKDVKIFAYVNLYGCTIGDYSRIGTFVEIQKNATIGRNCKISSHTFICEGVTIEDNVFIGHNVTFINDMYPRSTAESGGLQTEADWKVDTDIYQGGSLSRLERYHPGGRHGRRGGHRRGRGRRHQGRAPVDHCRRQSREGLAQNRKVIENEGAYLISGV